MAGRPLTGNLRIMARDKIIETQAAKLKNYERAMDYLCTVVPKLAECLQADPDFSARSDERGPVDSAIRCIGDMRDELVSLRDREPSIRRLCETLLRNGVRLPPGHYVEDVAGCLIDRIGEKVDKLQGILPMASERFDAMSSELLKLREFLESCDDFEVAEGETHVIQSAIRYMQELRGEGGHHHGYHRGGYRGGTIPPGIDPKWLNLGEPQ